MKVPFAKALFIVDQFCQFDEAHPQNVVGDIGSEDLLNVVQDSLGVEILIDVL